jgi:hypothetical protein
MPSDRVAALLPRVNAVLAVHPFETTALQFTVEDEIHNVKAAALPLILKRAVFENLERSEKATIDATLLLLDAIGGKFCSLKALNSGKS